MTPAGPTRGIPLATLDDEDDVSCLLLGLDVAGRVGGFLQPIGAVDDSPIGAGLDELLEAKDLVLGVPRDRHHRLLGTDEPGPQRQRHVLGVGAEVGRDVAPTVVQRAFALPERLLADGVEHDVVGLAVGREVLDRVVDDLVGAERPHDIDVVGVAHSGDQGAHVLGQLDGGGADRTRRAVDQDALPGSEACPRQAGHAEDCAIAHRSRLLERHAGRLRRDRSALPHAQVLGVRSEPVSVDAEDLVADGKLRHSRPGFDDDSRELAAEDRPLRPSQPCEGPDEPGRPRAEAAVGPVHRGGVHLHEHLVVGRDRPLHIEDPQDVGSAVLGVDHCAHAARWASLAGGAVDRLADEVGVAVVAGVLLDHVHEDPAQAGSSAVGPGAPRRLRQAAVRQHLGEDLTRAVDRLLPEREQLLGRVLGGRVPVPVGVGVPVHRVPRLRQISPAHPVREPVVLDRWPGA